MHKWFDVDTAVPVLAGKVAGNLEVWAVVEHGGR